MCHTSKKSYSLLHPDSKQHRRIKHQQQPAQNDSDFPLRIVALQPCAASSIRARR